MTGFQDTVRTLIDTRCPHAGLSLDLGCGDGRYHPAYHNRVIGIEMIDTVRHAPEGVYGRMERLPLRSGSFDFVTCFQALYYVSDLHVTLAEVRRVSRAGAELLISVSKPAVIAANEEGAQQLQRLPARRWLQCFEQAGLHGQRLYPGFAGRLTAALSPYFWFRLQAGQVAP